MEFLSIKEVSRILKISLRTAYRLANQGRIKSIRVGGRLRCYKEDVEKCGVFGTGAAVSIKSTGTKKERRNHPRINSNFTCRYFINLIPYKNISETGIIKNISAGGVFLDKNRRDMDTDDPIEIQFKLEGTDITACGRIIRKEADGAAVKFRNLDVETENKIIHYIG